MVGNAMLGGSNIVLAQADVATPQSDTAASQDTAVTPQTGAPVPQADADTTSSGAATASDSATPTAQSDPAVAEGGVSTDGDAAAELAAQVEALSQPSGFLAYLGPAGELLDKGGIAIWAIAALSVLTMAIILWKLWRFMLSGVWRKSRAELAVAYWQSHDDAEALETARAGRGVRAQVALAAMEAARTMDFENAREETVRVAKIALARARSGLRALELIATVAPLLGLFGTVLGMIAAFQQLQAAGTRADPSALAGGIWEALLTTAAGMAVAIPASAALTWFESITDRLRLDLEDIATRIFTRAQKQVYAHAAE